MSSKSTAIFHCLNGKSARKRVMKKAKKSHLEAEVLHKNNPHAFKITGKTKYVDKFIQRYQNRSHVGIFSEHDKVKFRSHLRINKAVAQTSHTPNYGNTAVVIGQHYNLPTSQNGTAPTIGIISLGGTYLTSDLTHYWSTIQGLSTYPQVSYVDVGTSNRPNQPIKSNDGSDENTLDLSIAGTWCPKSHLVMYFGQNTTQGFYNAINTAINDNTNKPSIISISWGSSESDYTSSQLTSYDQLFQSANSKGITICVAAGDNGSNDGVGDNKLHVDFPSSSPHVTSCGGSSLTTPESTWSWNGQEQWGTGGGISSEFAIPSYQNGVVTYPTNTTPSITSLHGHRGVPDVALNANPSTGWTIYFNGQLYTSQFGGTSCVAPAMAGLLGLMNLRYPVNFNTNLYSLYQSNRAPFVDITTGSNDSLRNSSGTFNAGSNYDFCTGLGALNGQVLFNALKNIVSTHSK